jgi:hypothetical protein
MSASLFCTVSSEYVARNIVEELEVSGVFSKNVSVLFPDRSETTKFAHDKHTDLPKGASTGILTGGTLGGAIGWLAGIGSLAIPGIGPFIAAGPIMSAIGGATIGATVGGVAGVLINLGITKLEADHYEAHIRAGSILISVHDINDQEINHVKRIFSEEGANDIAEFRLAAGDIL